MIQINTTAWNKTRYTLYAPFYDVFGRVLQQGRQQAISLLRPKTGKRLLIIGCGTGLELDYLPDGLDITAIDIAGAMVQKAKIRAQQIGIDIHGEVMDAESLSFDSDSFDFVTLHLVLAVSFKLPLELQK